MRGAGGGLGVGGVGCVGGEAEGLGKWLWTGVEWSGMQLLNRCTPPLVCLTHLSPCPSTPCIFEPVALRPSLTHYYTHPPAHSPVRCEGNLEAIHDTLHEDVGGWMRQPISAAFDPLFWLHHAFVDYLFFLWQANFPSVWITPSEGAPGGAGDIGRVEGWGMVHSQLVVIPTCTHSSHQVVGTLVLWVCHAPGDPR